MVGSGELAFLDLPVLSLLPRTLGSRYAALVTPGKISEDKELDALKVFFKSTISDCRMEPTAEAKEKAKNSNEACKEVGNQTGSINHKDQKQGRRPGLGRKRARFSFNQNGGDSILHVDTRASLDHIKDPEEFFAAVERMEYADKVLKKLRGEADNESSKNLMLTPSKKRRPGILRRRTSYKQHFRTQLEHIEVNSISQCENQALCPSKLTPNDSTSIPVSVLRNQHGTLQDGEADATSSPAKEEKSVDCILDNILYSFEDVNEGEEIAFLEERLQIKSINVDKVCLPPLDRCHGSDLLITDGQSSQKVVGSSATDSRNAARSPLASLAALKRRILRKDPLDDPFHLESPSDSSSENSASYEEGFQHLSKTRSRSSCRRDSISWNVAKTPTSDPLANDVASKTTKDIAENKVDRMLFEDLISNEFDHWNLESNFQTSEATVGIDNRTNDGSIETGVLANKDREVGDAPVEASFASEADATDEAMHLEDRSDELVVEAVDVVHDALESPASIGVKETVIVLNHLSDVVSNSFDTSSFAKVAQETNPKEQPRSPVSERSIPITLDNGMNAISDVINIAVLSAVVVGDSKNQEALITNRADCGDEEFPVGFANQGIPVNADLPEVSNPTINWEDNVRQALLSKNKETDEESNCKSIIQEKPPEPTIRPSLTTPNNQINGIKYCASNVEARINFNFSSEEENDRINKETSIMNDGVSPDKKSLETRVNADWLEIVDVHTDRADGIQEACISKNKGPGSEPNCRSTVQDEQLESIAQHNLVTPRNISSHQIDGIESDASNVAVATIIDFSSEDENDDINEETFIMTEAEETPFVNGGDSDHRKVGENDVYKLARDCQEDHGSNNKESFAESISRTSIQKERPESTMQFRNVCNHQIDGIQLDASIVMGPATINFSCEDENDEVNDETLIMNEAGATHEEIHVDYSVDAESQEIGGLVTDNVNSVPEADASNRRVEGCSGSSGILNEPIPEAHEESQANSDPSVEVVPQKRQSKKKQMNRRQSLAGAGTAWQSGVRRSTRIRTKPLAHWRGERILYARIHDTLPTMIGMKYASPGKSNQKVPPPLKVKSFVSEEYADLLHQIALH